MDITINSVGVVWFVAVFFGLPILGWLAMVIDYRAYLRSFRRALVVISTYKLESPLWALRDRPSCLEAFDLDRGCTREEVMAAYRSRVKEVHPDHGGDRRRFDKLQQDLRDALKLVEAGAAHTN